jgi:hypothetical protein
MFISIYDNDGKTALYLGGLHIGNEYVIRPKSRKYWLTIIDNQDGVTMYRSMSNGDNTEVANERSGEIIFKEKG